MKKLTITVAFISQASANHGHNELKQTEFKDLYEFLDEVS